VGCTANMSEVRKTYEVLLVVGNLKGKVHLKNYVEMKGLI
jgi:hypothetical protein